EGASGPDVLDWRERTKSLEQISWFTPWQATLTNEGEPERISGSMVSANFFHTLRTSAHLGRTFLPEEELEGRDRGVVLSYALWQRRFGGNGDVIGKSITLNLNPYIVAGVMGSDFRFPSLASSEIWAPLGSGFLAKQGRRSDFLGVIGRLGTGASLLQAQAEMN